MTLNEPVVQKAVGKALQVEETAGSKTLGG